LVSCKIWNASLRPTLHWESGPRSTQIQYSIGAKIEIKPKGFTQGVKVEREKNILIYPKLLINAEFYYLVLTPRLIKIYHQTWEANL
jgi:hypothetical protein